MPTLQHRDTSAEIHEHTEVCAIFDAGREYQRLLGGEVVAIYGQLDDEGKELLEGEAARLIAEQRSA